MSWHAHSPLDWIKRICGNWGQAVVDVDRQAVTFFRAGNINCHPYHGKVTLIFLRGGHISSPVTLGWNKLIWVACFLTGWPKRNTALLTNKVFDLWYWAEHLYKKTLRVYSLPDFDGVHTWWGLIGDDETQDLVFTEVLPGWRWYIDTLRVLVTPFELSMREKAEKRKMPQKEEGQSKS